MIRTFAIAASVALFASSAMAAGTCSKAAADKFKPQADLVSLLKTQGLTVSKTKVEGGCYEVYATDASGKKHNMAYNAETFEKLSDAEAGEKVK